jgi:uncharacterized repeat protein (TIGR03803 family)
MARTRQSFVSAAMFALAASATPQAPAQTYTMLHRFTGTDGVTPLAGLIGDQAGSFFGTTYAGGAFNQGTVFKLNQTGLTVLYSFQQSADGARPAAGVIRDAAGNLYGTAKFGGSDGNGVVFMVDTAGTETVLHNFTGKRGDGQFPVAGVVQDSAGDLYGITQEGGIAGVGIVFELSKTGETVLHGFTGGTEGPAGDGAVANAGLIRDAAGNLYGTTQWGGASGCGVVFKVDAAGTETVLYSFTGGADGRSPEAGLIQDSASNLYGTAEDGGAGSSGVVFKLDTAGTETVLHTFTGGSDGAYPYAGLFRDSAENLYGTASIGGVPSTASPTGCGVVFKIAP